ncbi:MAG: tRNA (adenosine(37)-N6)-threonylcarbamoyltransferase complex dimerization subunit type 1 TsaB [Planctomycetota bacterium]|jgi:tRNA threonylcarbamoyladenosine biosynthesis protein TsaB
MSKSNFNKHSLKSKSAKARGFRDNKQTGREPLILAVETSAPIGSVAVTIGGQLLAESTFSTPMKHTAQIFPVVCGLLNKFGRKPREIEHIYISTGPGSFTGIRIAVTLAKAMHLANNTKIVPVDSLDVIAENAADYIKDKGADIQKIAAVLDAKRSQFFIAVYQCNAGNEKQTTKPGIWEKILPDSLMTASAFLESFAGDKTPIWLLGVGLVYYKDKFQADGIRFLDKCYWSPKAEKVHSLGWKMAQKGRFADPLTLTPTYLRKPVG